MSQALYLSTFLSAPNFHLKIHLLPTIRFPLGRSTKSHTSFSVKYSISFSIASFNLLLSGLDIASLSVFSLSWKWVNYNFTFNIHMAFFFPFFFGCVYIPCDNSSRITSYRKTLLIFPNQTSNSLLLPSHIQETHIFYTLSLTSVIHLNVHASKWRTQTL